MGRRRKLVSLCCACHAQRPCRSRQYPSPIPDETDRATILLIKWGRDATTAGSLSALRDAQYTRIFRRFASSTITMLVRETGQCKKKEDHLGGQKEALYTTSQWHGVISRVGISLSVSVSTGCQSPRALHLAISLPTRNTQAAACPLVNTNSF
jgi:hypothetical protein